MADAGRQVAALRSPFEIQERRRWYLRCRPTERPTQPTILTLRRLVVDSSRLQSKELRHFLGTKATNIAVVPDFAWFELYKQESVEAVLAFLSVIGDFPDQIIVLKSGREIAKLDPADPDAMASSGVAPLIREMVDIMRGPLRDDPTVLRQLRSAWGSAASNAVGMLKGIIDIVASLPEMSDRMFSNQEVRIIRTNGVYTTDMFAKVFGAAEQIWETLAEGLQVQWRSMSSEEIRRAYFFRYALGIVIYLLWWIRSDSPKLERLDRVRNDIIDISFAVYGTYYDGFLTADLKAEWMFWNLKRALGVIDA